MKKSKEVEPENPESLSESPREPPDFMMRGLFAALEWLSAFLLVLISFPAALTMSLARKALTATTSAYGKAGNQTTLRRPFFKPMTD